MRVKLKHLPPNAVTASSLVLGLFAVFLSFSEHFELAAWFIVWCTFLDKADGAVARLLKAQSDFGIEFDSFADFVAFGIAPGMLFHNLLLKHPDTMAAFSQGAAPWLLRAAVCFYILTVGLRLARFNVDSLAVGDRYFVGLPTTLCGGLLASFYLAYGELGLTSGVLKAYPIYLVIFGFLMISTLRLPKFKRRSNPWVNWFQNINLLGAMVIGVLRLYPTYLFCCAALYAVGGVFYTLITGAGKEAEPTPSEPPQ